MDDRQRLESLDRLDRGARETDSIDASSIQESGLTQTFQTGTRERVVRGLSPAGESEADIILIAHPEGQRLGSRFRLSPGTTLEIGRSSSVAISLPEVMSISRKHARLRYIGSVVTIEDLGSTNGTYVNGQPIHGRAVLRSGDRFQTAAVHFKFLHEPPVIFISAHTGQRVNRVLDAALVEACRPELDAIILRCVGAVRGRVRHRSPGRAVRGAAHEVHTSPRPLVFAVEQPGGDGHQADSDREQPDEQREPRADGDRRHGHALLRLVGDRAAGGLNGYCCQGQSAARARSCGPARRRGRCAAAATGARGR